MSTDPHLDRANIGESSARARRGSWRAGALAIVGLTLMWVLLTPPGAGADEPSHLTRSAALVRDTPGRPANFESRELYLLPDWIEIPEPACYAFQPGVSAACAPILDRTGALVELSTRADEYPPGAHVIYGLATLVPRVAAVWPARLVGVVVISALLTASFAIRRRRGALATSGLFVALTPMAWGTFATVNPSAFTIAGAVALWAALIELALQAAGGGPEAQVVDRSVDRAGDRARRAGHTDRLTAWLLVAGWTACVLPRRDGTVWACLIVAIVVVATDLPLASIARSIGPAPLAIVALTIAGMTLWAVTDASSVTRLMAIAPLALVGAEVVRWWRSRAITAVGRWLPLAATAIGAILTVAITAIRRSGGADAVLTRYIIRQTPRHLKEAIGVLGWLDAPIPLPAVWGWVVLVVVALVGAASARDKRWFGAAIATLLVAIVSSWILELASGSDSGRYWQGRYSLPVLVGIALLATSVRRRPERSEQGAGASWWRREAAVLTVGALGLVNVAAWAVSRRWAVGVEGPLAVTAWPITILPVRPIYPLFVLALVSLAVTAVAVPRRRPDPV